MIEQSLHEALTAPLDALVDGARRRTFPAGLVDGWDLPAADRDALRRFGLPTDLPMRPMPQPGREPVLAPNLAGPQERGLAADGERLYDLGAWSDQDGAPRIGAVAGTGRVLALRERPLTAADLHPTLRGIYRDLYRPAVAYLNTSVARFVEIAWRWRAAAELRRRLEEPPFPGTHAQLVERLGSADRAAEVLRAWEEACDAHLDLVDACGKRTLAAVRAVDPTQGPGGAESLWLELLLAPV
ncbi:SUKH-4 family immunity protein [Actinomadura parmotrematis]|uniref:SUKH-4 family immunity protein n=1 Tax=Actinomadura parmotrematis TaxID=2864039 RepID=A0ABS7FS56_9ACTN|nr:SUKH-4 family immunity protein [Actinomadura parmotrematis]MBW8482397.1 SUKH-4 family immunity protein [Actinomadura parmotrematis]